MDFKTLIVWLSPHCVRYTVRPVTLVYIYQFRTVTIACDMGWVIRVIYTKLKPTVKIYRELGILVGDVWKRHYLTRFLLSVLWTCLFLSVLPIALLRTLSFPPQLFPLDVVSVTAHSQHYTRTLITIFSTRLVEENTELLIRNHQCKTLHANNLESK